MVVLCFTTGFAQRPSKSFKTITKTYQGQVKIFFVDVFELQKTGETMALNMRAEVETKIYEAFLADFISWKIFSQKHEGDKKFNFMLKGTKGFETESKEYSTQFKAIMNEFVKERLIWSESELPKILTKERLQKYISPVMEKFKNTTLTMFNKLASTK